MSLQISSKAITEPQPHRYFLYLKEGKIFRTVFYDHPLLGWLTVLTAILVLHRSGLKWLDILKLGGRILQMHRRLNAIVVEFTSALTPEQIEWLKSHLGVDIEPVKAVTAYLNKASVQTEVSVVKATTPYTGKGIKVAVVDTGINDRHVDLAGKVVARQDFSNPDYSGKSFWPWDWFKSTPSEPKATKLDGVGHGTWCAGAIAGGGQIYQGMAPKVILLDARVLNSQGHGSNDGVIRGMSWAADQGADIISMSLGGEGTPDDAVSREADALASEGIVIVVAAGNEGPHKNTIGSPSCAAKVITVAAVDQQNKVTQYSSRGPVVFNGLDLTKPDIAAPGGGTTVMSQCFYQNGVTSVKSFDTNRDPCTVTAADGTQYQRMSGTSMATPIVAGICALILEASKWTSSQRDRCELVKQAIKSTAKKIPYTADDCGVGLIDAQAAINQVKKD